MNPSYDARRHEIPTRDLLRAALLRWPLLLAAAIFGCALGCFLALRSGSTAPEDTEGAASYETQLAAYETDLISYSALIARTEELLREKRAYIASSYLTAMDPAHVGRATATLVLSPSASYPDAQQLADTYAAFITGGIDWSIEAEKAGTDSAYLAELVSTTPELASSSSYAGDTDAEKASSPRGTVTVTIVHTDAEKASALMDVLLDQLSGESAQLQEILGAHRVTVAGRTEGYVADTAIGSRTENLLQETYTLTTNLERLSAQLAKLKKPSGDSGTSSVSGKTLLKYALAGLLAGALAMLLVLFACAALSGRLLGGDELRSLYGLPVLAEPGRSGGKKSLSEADRRLLAAEILALSRGASGAVLLTGDVPEEELRALAASLAEACAEADAGSVPKLLHAQSPGADPDALRALRSCDAVFLVEREGVSRHAQIERDFALLTAAGAQVCGAVLI